MQNILIVDDQSDIRILIQGILEDEGYTTSSAKDSQSAEQSISETKPDLVILDIWLENSELDGMELLKKIKKSYADTPVIMISGHGSIETAVKAIHLGAYDFIEKPFKTDKLLVLVSRALETARLKKENQELRLKSSGYVSEIQGISQHVQSIQQSIERVAPTNSRVLITGNPGTGKEVVARMIHTHSKRADKSYVSLNCSVSSADRIELEIFGSEGGKYGHVQGALERADGGTLFLDEVGDLPFETQAKLVRALQDQSFSRLDGIGKVDIDVRIIAASSHRLKDLMEEGRFRQDLYYRLNVVPIHVPSLQERLEDIPVLSDFFMRQAADAANTSPRQFSSDAMALMQSYEWPGNVRQLKNVIEWVLIMAGGSAEELVTADMLPPDLKQKAVDMIRGSDVVELMSKPLREAREIFEREYLLSQVNRFGGNISRTAHFIGMERSALHRKLKSLGVQTNEKEKIEG